MCCRTGLPGALIADPKHCQEHIHGGSQHNVLRHPPGVLTANDPCTRPKGGALAAQVAHGRGDEAWIAGYCLWAGGEGQGVQSSHRALLPNISAPSLQGKHCASSQEGQKLLSGRATVPPATWPRQLGNACRDGCSFVVCCISNVKLSERIAYPEAASAHFNTSTSCLVQVWALPCYNMFL